MKTLKSQYHIRTCEKNTVYMKCFKVRLLYMQKRHPFSLENTLKVHCISQYLNFISIIGFIAGEKKGTFPKIVQQKTLPKTLLFYLIYLF